MSPPDLDVQRVIEGVKKWRKQRFKTRISLQALQALQEKHEVGECLQRFDDNNEIQQLTYKLEAT